MGFPPACIPTCLYLLLTTDSFEEAVTDVVNMGGDADSAGAILGALAGAHYGAGAIPERWLARLQNREAIELRAMAIHARSADGYEIPDLVEREHELSALEGSCREGRAECRLGQSTLSIERGSTRYSASAAGGIHQELCHKQSR